MRIVIVDDDRLWTELLGLWLRSQGYAPIVVHTEEHAYATIKAQQPAIVIQDLRIEHADSGWRVLDQLRGDAATAQIPVIVVSAERDVAQQAHARGLDRVVAVTKPCAPNRLVEIVNQMVQARTS